MYSIQCRLLPFLDQQPLYNATNFDRGTWPLDGYMTGGQAGGMEANLTNVTIYQTTLALFLCPSDGGPFVRNGNNYRGNVGVGPSFDTWAETPDSGNGVFPEGRGVRISQLVDGLSHTVAFSERVRGSAGPSTDPERDIFKRYGIVNTADQLLIACRIAARSSATGQGFTASGKWWFWTGRERTLYNHAQSPNGSIPDCSYGGMTPMIDMATARSRHPGAVNVMMADGSTRFVSSSINQDVWRGLGTRNGRELVD